MPEAFIVIGAPLTTDHSTMIGKLFRAAMIAGAATFGSVLLLRYVESRGPGARKAGDAGGPEDFRVRPRTPRRPADIAEVDADRLTPLETQALLRELDEQI